MADGTDTSGGMTPQQMMYAMALMSAGGGNNSSGQGAWGGMSNAVSPVIRALMMNRLMNAGTAQTPQQMTGYAPSMSPGQSGTGGFVAPYGPAAQGYSQSGAGYTPGGNFNAYATPSTAGAIAPTAAGGGIGGSPGVSTLANPYGNATWDLSGGSGYGASYPYGIGSSVPNY